MTDKNRPVCAPMMTTLTPVSDAVDLAILKKVRPVIIEQTREQLAREFPADLHLAAASRAKERPLIVESIEKLPDGTTVATVRIDDADTLARLQQSGVSMSVSGGFPADLTLANVGGDHEVGTENELAARWRKLLYAESVLDAQVTAINDVLDDAPSYEVGEDGNAISDFVENMRKVLTDVASRPSPDYRALLANTRVQLDAIIEVLGAGAVTLDPAMHQTLRGHVKEAMRLTDVERLKPWTNTIEAQALRHVVDELSDELEHTDVLDDVLWFEETARDLREARTKPAEYLARKEAEAIERARERTSR